MKPIDTVSKRNRLRGLIRTTKGIETAPQTFNVQRFNVNTLEGGGWVPKSDLYRSSMIGWTSHYCPSFSARASSANSSGDSASARFRSQSWGNDSPWSFTHVLRLLRSILRRWLNAART